LSQELNGPVQSELEQVSVLQMHGIVTWAQTRVVSQLDDRCVVDSVAERKLFPQNVYGVQAQIHYGCRSDPADSANQHRHSRTGGYRDSTVGTLHFGGHNARYESLESLGRVDHTSQLNRDYCACGNGVR